LLDHDTFYRQFNSLSRRPRPKPGFPAAWSLTGYIGPKSWD